MEENDSAFPHETWKYHDGLTMRDYIAIQAMQGWVSNPDHSLSDSEYIARQAYKLADAMIKESNNETKTED